MSEFKVGDRVKVTGCNMFGHKGNTGEVVALVGGGMPRIRFNGSTDYWDCTDRIESYELLEKTLYNLVEGDVVVDWDGYERTILGIAGKVYFISVPGNPNIASSTIWTAKELKERGWKLKTDSPEEEEKIEIEGKEYTVSEIKEALKK